MDIRSLWTKLGQITEATDLTSIPEEMDEGVVNTPTGVIHKAEKRGEYGYEKDSDSDNKEFDTDSLANIFGGKLKPEDREKLRMTGKQYRESTETCTECGGMIGECDHEMMGVEEGEIKHRLGDKGEPIRQHLAKAGGYGRKIDKDDDTGDKFHSSDIDDTDDEPTFPSIKRGRGRPQKGGDSETGQVKKFDTDALASWIIGNKPKNIDKIGKVSHVHKLKEYMQQVESSKLFESVINEGKMKEVAAIIQEIVDGELELADFISPDFKPSSKVESFLSHKLKAKFDQIARENELDPDADSQQIYEIMMDQIHDIMLGSAINNTYRDEYAGADVAKDIDLKEFDATNFSGQTTQPSTSGQAGTQQSQNSSTDQTGVTQQAQSSQQAQQKPQQNQTPGDQQHIQTEVPVKLNGQVVGFAPNKQAANQAVQKIARQRNLGSQNQKELANLGFSTISESKQMTKQTLNESADAKLIMEGMTLEEILELHPHEHKMCQEGWGMDECLYEALCDHYYKEGRIPRKIWHGPLEQLRDFVEECYMQDTQPLIDSTVDEAFIDSTANELGEEYIDATANELDEERYDWNSTDMDEAIDGTFASGDIDEGELRADDHAMSELIDELDEEYSKTMKDSSIDRDPIRGFVGAEEKTSMNESKEFKMEDKTTRWKNAALTRDQINGSTSPDVWDKTNIDNSHVIRAARDNPARSVLKNKLRASAEKEMDKVHNRQRNISTSDVQADESKESTLKRDNRAEKAGRKVAKDLEYDMKHKGKDDNKAERAGKKVTKDIEWDEKHKLDEKWAGDTKLNPAKKGMFKGKTKAELEKELTKLHKSGPHKRGSPEDTKQKELNFAIRAKSGWKEGIEEEVNEDFASVEKAVAKNPKIKDPAAVAAAIGRKKLGQKEMTRRSVAGRKHVKESVEFSAWERQLESLINEDFTVNTTKSSRPEGNSVNVSATGAEADELLAIIQRAGLTGETARSSMQQAFDNSPDVMAVEVDDACEDMPMGESSMEECYMEDEATEEALMPVQKDNAVVMAMPLGMGMSQNSDSEQDCDAPEAVEQEDIKGIIDQLVGDVDDSGDDSLLSAIKKLIGHGAAEIEVVSTDKADGDDHGYKDEESIDEDNYSSTQQSGIPATGGSMSPVGSQPQQPVTETGDEEMEEGAGIMHFKDEQAKKAGKDSFTLGGKKFPVKEEEEVVNPPDELESEDQGISAQNMAAAEFKFEESRSGSLADVLARLDALSDGDTVASKLDEWANSANDQGKEEKFETDVDFMTRSISGGLNNAKQDQTLIGSGQGRVQTSDERSEVKNSIGAMLRKLDGINE